MQQCEYCLNKEQCKKHNWVTTCDNGYKIKELNEWKCDNFKLEKGCSITCVKKLERKKLERRRIRNKRIIERRVRIKMYFFIAIADFWLAFISMLWNLKIASCLFIIFGLLNLFVGCL